MKLKYRSLIFLLFPLLILGCGSTKITSTFLTNTIKIDGNVDEWPKTAPVILADSSITVRAANDRQNIYLAIETNDPEYMLDFQHSGITFWVDLYGGKGKQVEAHFPAGLYASFDRNRGGFWQSLNQQEKEQATEKISQLARGILVINRANDRFQDFPADNPTGFAAAYTRNRKLAIMELRIPLQFQEPFLTMELPDNQKSVGIGFQTGSRISGGFQRQEMSGPGESMEGGRSFGRRGPYGGGSSENKDFWLEVYLAK
jgi:hypothetical protein